MNKYSKLKNNTIVFTIGNIGSSLISFLLLPIFTRSLTSEQYGIIDFVNITITLIIPFISLNISEAVLRYGIDKSYNKKKVLSTSLIVIILNSLVVGGILITIIKIFKLQLALFNLIIIIFINMYYAILKQFCRVINKLKIYAISDILYTFVFAVLNIIIVVKMEKGIQGYFLAYFLANLIGAIFICFSASVYKYFSFKEFEKTYFKEFIKYSLPLIPNSISWWVVNTSDRYLITLFSDISALGVYSVANKIPSVLNTIYGILMKAWQISSFEEYENKDIDGFYSCIFNYLVKIIFLIAMVLTLFLPIIMNWFIGKEFYEAIYYIPILLLGFVFYTFAAFLGTIYTAAKNTKGVLNSTLISAFINILINIIFMPYLGAIVAAISTCISYIYLFIYRMIDTKKYINVKIYLNNLIIPILVFISQNIILFTLDNIMSIFSINLILILFYFVINIKDIYKLIKNKE